MSVNRSTLNRSTLLDDEFISCENCQILFEKNEIEHVAANGAGCNHSFCRPCVKSQISSDTGVLANCPQCKLSKTKSEKQNTPFPGNPDWCSNCNIAASVGCRKGQHVIQSINDLFIERSQMLKALIDQTNLACDCTLKDYNDIQSVHKVILAWIGWLQQKISQWNSSNTATIAQLESLKTTVRFRISPQEDMSSTINQINQLIAEFDGKHQLATAIQFKGSNLIQTYRNAKWGSIQSAQTSSSTKSPPLLANWFSTALSHDHKSCRDVLSFLVRLLNKEESVPRSIPSPDRSSDGTLLSKQNDQVKDGRLLEVDNSKTVDRNVESRCIQPVQKRQLEEVSGSETRLIKKARLQSPHPINDEREDINIPQSAVNLAVKEEMKLQVATVKEKLSHLTRQLQDTENKLKLSEEKVAVFTNEKARQLKVKPIPVVRFVTGLTLHVEKVKLAEDSKANANHDSSILLKVSKATGENCEMVLILSTADVEQLHLVRDLLGQGQSRAVIVLQEKTNQTAPKEIEKPLIGEDSAEKRCHQLQKEVEEMKNIIEKSTTELIEARLSKDHLLLAKAQMEEEVRKAKEESQNLQSKMIAAEAKHVQELNQFSKYKTLLDWLTMHFQEVIAKSRLFCCQRFSILPEVVDVKAEMQWILKIAKLQQVKEQNECAENLKKVQLSRQTSSQQRLIEMDPVEQTVPILQRNPVLQQVTLPSLPNFVKRKKATPFIVYNFNAMAESILMELHSKGTSLRYHCCVGCKSLVETRHQCNQCPNVIFCITCYPKEKRCHRMKIFGFDLDVELLPANCKTIEEARNLKIEQRITTFFHGLRCVEANCCDPFCTSMKLIIAHCRQCQYKMTKAITGSSLDSKSICAICGDLVALIIYHAKLCTDPVCQVPHCSKGKTWIKTINSRFPEIKKAKRKGATNGPSSEPRPLLTPNNVNGLNSELSCGSLNSNQLQELDSSALANDVAVMSNQSVSSSAPHVEASTSGTQSQTARTVTTQAEKLKIMLKNIILMIHAHQCNQQQNQGQQCLIPFCQTMKIVLQHVRSCVNLQPCQPHCRPTRMLISHLKNCSLPDCVYCSVISDADRYNAITGPNPIVIASELPSSKICSVPERVHNLPHLTNNDPGVSNLIPNSRAL